MPSVTARPPAPPPSTSTPVAPPKLRYRSNPLRPIEKPVNPAHSKPKAPKTTTKSSTLPPPPSTTPAPSTSSALPSHQPTAGAAGGVSASTAAGVANAADPTTLPRGKVTDVNRRIEDGVHKTTITIKLTSGEERSVTDSGVESVKVSSDLQVGDGCSLHPTGLGSYTWTKDADSTVASAKPRRKRRVFTVDDLIGERGIRALLSTLPTIKWQGYGYEAADLHQLMFLYKVWAKEMYPFDHFQVVMRRSEVMGASSRVQRYMDAFRYPEEGVGEEGGASKRVKGDGKEERRVMNEAASALMDDVYGEREGRAEDVLREARVGQGGEFDDALRSIGILPPLLSARSVEVEPSAQPLSAVMEEEKRQRVEDNKRRALERLAAKKRQQLQDAESAATAVDEPSPRREMEPAVDSVSTPPQPDDVPLPPRVPDPIAADVAVQSEGEESEGEAVEEPTVADDSAHEDDAGDAVDEPQSDAVEPTVPDAFFVPETLEMAEAEVEDAACEASVDVRQPDAGGVGDVDMIPSSLCETGTEWKDDDGGGR